MNEVPIARYLIWAGQHATPAAFHSERWGLLRQAAVAPRAKSRAVQCFESQLLPLNGRPIVSAHVLSHFEWPYEASPI